MPILLAGALPGAAAGNSVSTDTLLGALRPHGSVTLLTHEMKALPHARRNGALGQPVITLGAQPLMVHGEVAMAARMVRRELQAFDYGWAVNSRYAGALRLARIPYAVWEPTMLRDEMAITNVADVRRSRRGTGLGALLHKTLLPIDEHLADRIYRDAVSVLAMSEYTAERIRSRHRLAIDKVRVLRHPPAPAFLAALAHVRATRPALCVLPPVPAGARTAFRLIFVGRADDPRKNFRLLLETFRGLRAAGVTAQLTVIGSYGEAWRRSLGVDEHRDMRFLGRVSDEVLAIELLGHDALVVSSRQEGFGIVVAEAMHAGIPVISTRCGGPEELLRDSGGGVLVDQTVRSLVEALAELATDRDRCTLLGRAGRTYAERELSGSRFAERVASEVEILARAREDAPRR